MAQTASGSYRTPESRCLQRLSKKLPISIITEYHYANKSFLITLIFSIIVYIYAASNRIKPANSILPQLVAKLPWGHNILLIEKIKDPETRFWYARQCLENGWSRDSLEIQVKSQLHQRQGKVISNFMNTLPQPQSDLAQQTLKDPYVFDFLTLAVPFRERDVENQLVQHE